MSAEIATKNDLRSFIAGDKFKEQVALALPKHLTPDRFARIALTAITRNPKLLDCTRESLLRCLMDLSAMGIEPDGRRAHLIPYGKDCTLILDYKGIVEIVRRDPDILDVQCISIRENDVAEWKNGEMNHQIDPKKERGSVVSTYTRIAWRNGSISIGEPFSKDDAEHAKKSSKSASSGPWKDHYVEMWKKSNIKRDSKMWPLSPEIRDTLEKDEDHVIERNITPRQAVHVPVLDFPEKSVKKPEALPESAPHADFWEWCDEQGLDRNAVSDWMIARKLDPSQMTDELRNECDLNSSLFRSACRTSLEGGAR